MDPELIARLAGFEPDGKAVLCTILHARGSSPRHDFPMMVIGENGNSYGTVGGGSLEYDALNLAHEVIRTSRPMILRADMTGSDVTLADGLCGGTVFLLMEELTPDLRQFWRSAAVNEHTPIKIVITRANQSPHPAVSRDVILPEDLSKLSREVQSAVETVLKRQRSQSWQSGSEFMLVRYVTNKPVLHIFGAGHVGSAVARLAQQLEIPFSIYDDREGFLTADRFPNARSRVTAPLDDQLATAQISPGDLILIATRNHISDRLLLADLLGRGPGYVGVVSSRRKWRLISRALAEEGFPEEDIAAVHAPVGLDIGAQTVPEIALSILAQIIRHLRTAHLPKTK